MQQAGEADSATGTSIPPLAPLPFPLGKALAAMSQLQQPRKVPEGGTCQRKNFTPNPGQKGWAEARNMG